MTTKTRSPEIDLKCVTISALSAVKSARISITLFQHLSSALQIYRDVLKLAWIWQTYMRNLRIIQRGMWIRTLYSQVLLEKSTQFTAYLTHALIHTTPTYKMYQKYGTKSAANFYIPHARKAISSINTGYNNIKIEEGQSVARQKLSHDPAPDIARILPACRWRKKVFPAMRRWHLPIGIRNAVNFFPADSHFEFDEQKLTSISSASLKLYTLQSRLFFQHPVFPVEETIPRKHESSVFFSLDRREYAMTLAIRCTKLADVGKYQFVKIGYGRKTVGPKLSDLVAHFYSRHD